VNRTTAELCAEYYEGVPLTRAMGEFETFYSSEKLKRLTGWRPEHHWRMYLDDPRMA
jgi:hypothetical protein